MKGSTLLVISHSTLAAFIIHHSALIIPKIFSVPKTALRARPVYGASSAGREKILGGRSMKRTLYALLLAAALATPFALAASAQENDNPMVGGAPMYRT